MKFRDVIFSSLAEVYKTGEEDWYSDVYWDGVIVLIDTKYGGMKTLHNPRATVMSIGAVAMSGLDLFEGDIVSYEDKIYVVEWEVEELRYVIVSSVGVKIPITKSFAEKLMVLGHILVEKELLDVLGSPDL